VNIWNTRLIRRKWYDWPEEILKIMRPYKWLQMLENFLRMPLRILQMLANAFANACERTYTWNDYTTHAWRIAYKHLSNVSLCHLLASHRRILCEYYVCLRMPLLRKQWEYDIRQEFRNMFLNYVLFVTPHKWPRMLTNTYECLAITLRWLRIGGELHL
jgi:hypothetical protein